MQTRIAFLFSLPFVLFALGLSFGARGQLERGYQLMRDSGVQKFPVEQSHRAALLLYTSFPLAAASLAFLVVSYRRREPAWRWIIIVLLGLYLLVSFSPA